MEDKIKELAECLTKANRLEEELRNKEYWIDKAAKETDFVPAEGDWIHIEVTLFKIEVSVYHKERGGSKYWKNGVWCDDPFSSEYPLPEKMLAEMNNILPATLTTLSMIYVGRTASGRLFTFYHKKLSDFSYKQLKNNSSL